jgi:hypothetical protein
VNHKRFTTDEINLIRECCIKGMTCKETGELLGRPVESLRSLMPRLGLKFKTASNAGRKAVEVFAEDANAFRLPPAKYASRTAMFFGDPPIGRSALDQRQAQQ